jgi:hypothetical protein
MNMSRRNFLTISSGAACGLALNGCGQNSETVMSRVEGSRSPETATLQQATLEEVITLNNPAAAYDHAERGEKQTQIEAPPGPPRSWESGQFVRSALINYLGVGLNYDDGPSPYNTDPILRTLEKYDIRATFFLIGVNVIAWPEIAKRIADAGHELGNHSKLHDRYTASHLAAQIAENQEIIFNATGQRPEANRTPGLTMGQIILDTCRANGLYEVHTTIDSGDWRYPRIVGRDIANNVVAPIHAGAFPLQHDGGNSRPTPSAQEEIIQRLLAQGFIFDTVTNILNSGQPSPGGFTYASSNLIDQTENKNGSDIGRSESLEISPTCNYDPAKELETRFKDSSTGYGEKMRIAEAILQLEEAA